MPKKSFEDNYPNIARWVYEHEGIIEIGNDPDGPLTSFVRAIDMGGMPWEGRMSTNRWMMPCWIWKSISVNI